MSEIFLIISVVVKIGQEQANKALVVTIAGKEMNLMSDSEGKFELNACDQGLSGILTLDGFCPTVFTIPANTAEYTLTLKQAGSKFFSDAIFHDQSTRTKNNRQVSTIIDEINKCD